MADVIVLAKTAQQIAMCKEDRSRPVPADQGCLFAKVGLVGGHHGAAPRFADSGFSGKPVHLTALRTQGAVRQRLLAQDRPSGKKTGFQRMLVNGWGQGQGYLSRAG
jgi:hypothetical protein